MHNNNNNNNNSNNNNNNNNKNKFKTNFTNKLHKQTSQANFTNLKKHKQKTKNLLDELQSANTMFIMNTPTNYNTIDHYLLLYLFICLLRKKNVIILDYYLHL